MRKSDVHPEAVQFHTVQVVFISESGQEISLQGARPWFNFRQQTRVKQVDARVYFVGDELLGAIDKVGDEAGILADHDTVLGRVFDCFHTQSGFFSMINMNLHHFLELVFADDIGVEDEEHIRGVILKQ